MKWYNLIGLSAVVTLLWATTPTSPAHAQTQCPVGTAAGAATCAPDAPPAAGGYSAPSGPPVIRERLDGLGGFAINTDTHEVYLWTGYSNDFEVARHETLAKCQQPNYSRELSMSPPSQPDANCEVLTSWRNGCSALAKGDVEGVDHYFFEIGTNMRAARNATLNGCNQMAQGCMIVFDARCVSSSTRTRSPYDWERQN